MKKLLVLMLVALSFGACKKEVEVNPKPDEEEVEPSKPSSSAAAKVAGTYKLASFRFVQGNDEIDLPELPYSNGKTKASGTVKLVKTANNEVTLDFVLKVSSDPADDLTFSLEELEVKQVGKVYGLFIEGNRIADADGSNIIFNLQEKDPDSGETIQVAFTAKK